MAGAAPGAGFAAASPPPLPRRAVAVYRGEGAGWRSVQSTVASLSRLLARHEVVTLGAPELLAGGWRARTALLVMPGGADLPYCKHLNGEGNRLIREFVAAGGAYLGLCAGAYYACSRVEFEPAAAGPLAVVGGRELGFFQGAGRGAVVPGFDYQTERGAAAVRVRFAPRATLQRSWACGGGPGVPSNGAPSNRGGGGGGGTGTGSSSGGGGGGSPGAWLEARDYCNGGPFFVAPCGAAEWGPGGLPGVEVLARYVGLPPGTLARVAPRGGSGRGDKTGALGRAVGGEGTAGWGDAGAWASSGGGGSSGEAAVAAVRCRVGAGVAVLCGTHPELEPRWLDACGMTLSAEAAAAAAAGVASASAGAAAGAVTVAAAGVAALPAAAPALASVAAPATGTAGSGSGGGGGALAAALAGAPPASPLAAGAPPACPDLALARHTAALHAALSKDQASRDELLRMLLFAALAHQEEGPGDGSGGGGDLFR